jgi:hypothetical protein
MDYSAAYPVIHDLSLSVCSAAYIICRKGSVAAAAAALQGSAKSSASQLLHDLAVRGTQQSSRRGPQAAAATS